MLADNIASSFMNFHTFRSTEKRKEIRKEGIIDARKEDTSERQET